jgi:hypothetical protein
MTIDSTITRLISLRDQVATQKKLKKDQISIFNTSNKDNVIKNNNLNF